MFGPRADSGILGVLLWIPTLYAVPQAAFGLALAWAFVARERSRNVDTVDAVFLVVLTLLSSLNFVYGLATTPDGNPARTPYFFAYVGTYLLARGVNENDLRACLYCIGVEALFVYAEFALGINTIFTSNPNYRSGLTPAMLYFSRPFGLSDIQSVIGYKLFLALILLDYLDFSKAAKRRWLALMLPAFVLVFNRSALIAYAVYLVVKLLRATMVPGFRLRAVMTVVVLAGLLLALPDNVANVIWGQFNRNKDTVDLSYRDVIWGEFARFIADYPILGNGSAKHYAWVSDYGVYEHAHNSYLELIASNGLLISAVYALWFIVRSRRSALLYMLPVMIYSMSQYGFFWGVSFVDVIFLRLAFFARREEVAPGQAVALPH